MSRCIRVIGVALLLGAGVFACGGRPPAPSYDDVYKGLNENLPRLDPSILAGRRILIDPGHGGRFRGTRGQEGLEEAHVNLGVSLYLWGLLRETGAEVFLTRSAEKDFLTSTDSTLAGELAVRTAMVDSLKPHILVSVHHNAQNDRDPSKNSVETYYRFDDRASCDLAFAVHRHLMRNLGIDDGEVRPGNYFLLRNLEIPAIIGEASYLTHPGVEENLRLSEKQRLEAEAYFLGILEYFSRGTPTVESLAPSDSILAEVPTLRFSVSDIGGIGIDPASVELKINERPANAYLSGSGTQLVYPMAWDSPNGPYEIEAGVRNLLGNSSTVRRLRFAIDLPPYTAIFTTEPATLPAVGGTVRVRARLLDRRGLPVADGTTSAIRVSSGEAPDTTVVERGFVEIPVRVSDVRSPLAVALDVRQKTFQHTIKLGPSVRGLRRLVIADTLSRAPVRAAAVFHGDSLVAAGAVRGVYFLPINDSADQWIVAAGYEPRRNPSEQDTLYLTPWYDGKLLGRRFVIDPEGGQGPEAGMGALGLSGPFVNLQVALYLAEYLESAGAVVELTRRSEQTLSPRDVVALTNRFRAERYIEIRHRTAPADSGLAVNAYFFPGSGSGKTLAKDLQASAARRLGLAVRVPMEQVTFPLQQTACPAVVVEYPAISSLDEELRLGEPWYQRQQAYGVFAGILAHFEADDSTEVKLRVRAPGDDSANWLVTIDRTWNLLTGPDGWATFTGLPRGRSHAVDVRRGRSLARTWISPDGAGASSYEVIVEVAPNPE
jgi:N-acetylmuramoyl-L-alanine amidase